MATTVIPNQSSNDVNDFHNTIYLKQYLLLSGEHFLYLITLRSLNDTSLTFNTLTRNSSQLIHHQAAVSKPTIQPQQVGQDNVGKEGLDNTY
jgi:hypothetical protein